MTHFWSLGLAACLFLGAMAAPAQAQSAPAAVRAPQVTEQALDAVSFQGLDAVLAAQLTDVQSAVVMLGGRVVYSFYRDGNPGRLHDTQSVAKTAVSVLIGTAIAQKHIAGVDQPVVELMPEWQAANSDEVLPRPPLPTAPSKSDPFKVVDPDKE